MISDMDTVLNDFHLINSLSTINVVSFKS